MAINARDSFNKVLETFGSLYQDMSPQDLPEGLSPRNQDVWLALPGSCTTRPGFSRLLASPISDLTIMSCSEFKLPDGTFYTMFLDSAGVLHQRNNQSGTVSTVDDVIPGVQYKSENAFNKHWMAFYAKQLADDFSANYFVGVDIPRYYDGSNVWRVTQDAPGLAPSATDVVLEYDIVASPDGILPLATPAITAISENANNVVTVTVGTSLPTQLRTVDSVIIAGVTETGYNGTFPVFAILSATQFQYILGVSGLSASSGGTVQTPLFQVNTTAPNEFSINNNAVIDGTVAYDGTWPVRSIVSSTAFIISTFTIFGGPDGDGTVSVGGNVTAGVHKGVLIFESVNGAQTAPSLPFTWTSTGNVPFMLTPIAIGPPGTARRILAFTATGGSSYYYIRPVVIPGSTIPANSTIIENNTDQSATFNFTDVELQAGVQIDIEGNNLFNQIVLAPCLGVIEYQSRMFWWGEINNIKNFTNMAFDGGYVGTLGGTPLGWTQSGSAGGLIVADTDALGFSYEVISTGGVADGLISQSAYRDYYGAPIALSNKRYIFRVLARAGGTLGGSLKAQFSDDSGSIATATIPVSGMNSELQWFTAEFDNPMPAVIDPSTQFSMFLDSVPATTFVIWDECEIIDSAQPVLNTQMRASYVANPFGFDSQTGLLGPDTNESLVGAFRQRGYLYAISDDSLFQTLNNGSTEPDGWDFPQFAQHCGLSSPCAVDTGIETAWWVGKNGRMSFSGEPPRKISQELQPTWDNVNWAAELTIWLVNDSVERVLYCGLPQQNTEAPPWNAPSVIVPMFYRLIDVTENIPDPLASKGESFYAPALGRRNTKWNRFINCACIIRNGVTGSTGAIPQIIFGVGNGGLPGVGTGTGELYKLDSDKFQDDDFGSIPSAYTTYAYWSSELEDALPQLGAHRKMYTYLSAFVQGVGFIAVTPYVDRVNNAAPGLQTYELDQSPTFDLEWGINLTGDRVFFEFVAVPNDDGDAYFSINHIVVSGRMERLFPTRGSVL